MTTHDSNDFRPVSWEELQQPYVDGEFVVEEEPHVHDRPEWQVWLYFGQYKFDEATRYLRYLGERNGLYHYQDLRDGQHFSVPVIERTKEYFKEKRLSEVVNASARKGWKMGWGFLLATVLIMIWAGLTFAKHHPLAGDVFGWVIIILVLVIAPVMVLVQFGSKRRPRELPAHVMWFTDAELAEMQRRQNVQDAIALAVVAGYAAHKYHEHSQERLAHLIVQEEHAHDWNHRY